MYLCTCVLYVPGSHLVPVPLVVDSCEDEYIEHKEGGADGDGNGEGRGVGAEGPLQGEGAVVVECRGGDRNLRGYLM